MFAIACYNERRIIFYHKLSAFPNVASWARQMQYCTMQVAIHFGWRFDGIRPIENETKVVRSHGTSVEAV